MDARLAPRWLHLAALLAGALAAGGCVLDMTGKDRCSAPADCIDGFACVAGRCQAVAGDGDGDDPLCSDTCPAAQDGACDDGGEGADFDLCDLGTDCTDCGARGPICSAGTCTAARHACNEGRCMEEAEGPELFLCDDEAPTCPGAQVCLLGLCSPPCQDVFDCPLGTRCDEGATDRCVDGAPVACDDDGDCEDSQGCVRGLCTGTVQPQACDPFDDAACGPRESCLDVAPSPASIVTACVEQPACDSFDSCPTGEGGAVCNASALAFGKEKVCLIGRCTEEEHCPGGGAWTCLQPGGLGTLGWCSDFSLGSPCTDAEAPSCPGSVCATGGGSLGVCQ